MKFNAPYTAKNIAELIGASVIGDENKLISGINEIHKVQKGDVVFVDNEKYSVKTINSPAIAIISNLDLKVPEEKVLLHSEDPFKSFNQLILHFSSFQPAREQIAKDCNVGKNVVIQPGCFIGDGVKIGENTLIHANVTINSNCIIGANVIIHSGSVIGGDAFYYQKREGEYHKFNSCGRVVIHDNVEIGANCSLDRGVTGDTIIGQGTKLDNQVHVGHDVSIGQNCLFAAQVGIAGATVIEDDVVLWGQVGVISGITIGKGAVVLGQSGVGKSLDGQTTYFGSPASLARVKMQEVAALKKLPKIIKHL